MISFRIYECLRTHQIYGIRIRRRLHALLTRGLSRRKISVLFVWRIVHTSKKNCRFSSIQIKVFILEFRLEISKDSTRRGPFILISGFLDLCVNGKTNPLPKYHESQLAVNDSLDSLADRGKIRLRFFRNIGYSSPSSR